MCAQVSGKLTIAGMGRRTENAWMTRLGVEMAENYDPSDQWVVCAGCRHVFGGTKYWRVHRDWADERGLRDCRMVTPEERVDKVWSMFVENDCSIGATH